MRRLSTYIILTKKTPGKAKPHIFGDFKRGEAPLLYYSPFTLTRKRERGRQNPLSLLF